MRPEPAPAPKPAGSSIAHNSASSGSGSDGPPPGTRLYARARRVAETARAPKLYLLTVGGLVFFLLAIPDGTDLRIGGAELADFAQPRLVLAVLVLFACFSLFGALNRHVLTARALDIPVRFEIDPLTSEILATQEIERPPQELLRLGFFSRLCQRTLNLINEFVLSALVLCLAATVLLQLQAELGPVVLAASEGSRPMQVLGGLSLLLVIGILARALSCLLIYLAPARIVRETTRAALARTLVPLYVDIMRLLLALSGVRFADAFDAQPELHGAFGNAFGYSRPFRFKESTLAARIEASKKKHGLKSEALARSPLADAASPSNLQRSTMLKLLMLYTIEWESARKTSYRGPICARLRLGLRRRFDPICREMVAVAREPRTPAPEYVVATIEEFFKKASEAEKKADSPP